MSDINNTLFIHLEGPLQAWGTHESKFAIKRTNDAPTKSGLIGLICASKKLSRSDADANNSEWLKKFSKLNIGVRIDRPGFRWWDYHTIGADIPLRIAAGPHKKRVGGNFAILSRREYLCDASFLVAIMGNPDLIFDIHSALRSPNWTPYLGRKCCPPSVPIYNDELGQFDDLKSALCSIPWRPRYKEDIAPDSLVCLLDWTATEDEPNAPDDAEIWYDVPDSFVWPSHHPRFVIRQTLQVGDGKDVQIGEHTQNKPPSPERPRADYTDSEYKKKRLERLDKDHHLCVFCKSPATTVQHITYQHAGGNEQIDELRALCRLCHDAVTMLEYGEDMGMIRINPEEPKWRDKIIEKRKEIIQHRITTTRNRKLSGKEV